MDMKSWRNLATDNELYLAFIDAHVAHKGVM